MPVDAQSLISALSDRIADCPDVAGDAVERMSASAQGFIRAQIPAVFKPGRAPHSPPGTLAASVEQTYFSPGAVSYAHVAPGAVFARIQELGGVSGAGHRSVLPPRPYVAPAIAEHMEDFEQDAEDAVETLFW